MQVVLESNKVLKCIQEHPYEAYKERDIRCRSVTAKCIGNSSSVYTKDNMTACQMWTALENVFRRKVTAGQIYLRKNLFCLLYTSRCV